MLDPADLAAFIAIAEHRHFGRAAESLGTVQSVASKRLQRLEDQIGGRLVERTKRSNISLTRTGEMFLDTAVEAVAILRRAERSGNKIALGRAGPLRIGYVFSAAMSGLLSRSLNLLSEVVPEVVPVLDVMDTPAQLDAIALGTIDVGFVRPRPSYPDGVTAVRVHREPMILAMSREHPLASRSSVSPSDLVGLVFIVPQFHEEVGLIDVIRDLAREFDLGTLTTARTGDFISAASLAAAGKGVVLAPASLENLHLNDLCFRPIDGYEATLDLVIVVHPSVHGDIRGALLAGLDPQRRDSCSSRSLSLFDNFKSRNP